MMKPWKILAVIFCTICMAHIVANAANSNSSKRAAGYDDMYVTVKDAKGNPVSDVTVATLNTDPILVVHTDKNGVATFEGKCKAFANIGRTYTNNMRKKKTSSVSPVYIKLTSKNYKTIHAYLEWDDYSNKTGCERIIQLPKNAKRTYPKADKAYYAFSSITGNPYFIHACEGETLNGTKTGCVKDFAHINVQYIEGAELAKQYMLKKIIPTSDVLERGTFDMDGNLIENGISCEPGIRTRESQDYIACTSQTGRYAYDFEFDDLIESSDDSVQGDTAEAICNLHDGEFATENDNNYCLKNSKEETKKLCDTMKPVVEKFSWDIPFVENVFLSGFMKAEWTSACKFDFRDEYFSTYNPQTVDGLDNFKFQDIQVRSLSSLEFLLHQYTKAQLGNTFHSFSCASGFRKWDSPYGERHLLDCTFTQNGEKQTIEFVFKDLNVKWETKSNAGQGGINCIVAGGSFDGSRCHGLTHAQCDELDAKIPGGATWNSDINECTLNDAKKYETVKVVGDVIATTVTIAGAVVVVVVTAGTAAPAVVALVAVGGAASVGGTVLEKGTEVLMHEQTNAFFKAYDNCRQQPVEEQDPCARSVLQHFFGFMETYISQGVFEGSYASGLEDVFKKLIEMTEPETITENDISAYKLQTSIAKGINVLNKVGKYSAIVGDFILIFAGGAEAITKLSAHGITLTKNGVAVVNAANKTNKLSRFFARTYNLSKKPAKVADNVNTVNNNVQKMLVPSKTRNLQCWQGGYLVACS